MSKVFGAILMRRIQALESHPEIRWPAGLDTPERRRDWRRDLAGRHWNIFSRATLGNTRAVVRYLARYTSRIAIINQRITRIDEEQRTLSFGWKDYKDGGSTKEMTMSGATFLRCFTRHMVPKHFRRIRYFGLLAGAEGRHRALPGAPVESLREKVLKPPRPVCPGCGGGQWVYMRFNYHPAGGPGSTLGGTPRPAAERGNRFSLCPPMNAPPLVQQRG